jgi:hypothetical protein
LIVDPSDARVAADLEEGNFLSGRDAGRWRLVSYNFPKLDFAITATEPNGDTTEYGFTAELTNYPAQAPLVRIWDLESNVPLAVERRPNGGGRIRTTFQKWGEDTVYRPWDRMTGPHNNNAINFPHLAWRPERHLAFIFEDLYGILNSNARTHRIRASA